MSNFFQVNDRDFNLNWESLRDPVVLDSDEVILQAISNVLFINTNEIYFGTGNELGLPDQLFEFISDISDSLPLREIKAKLRALDSRINLDIASSSITPVGDEYQMHLVFAIDGRTRTLDRRIQV